MRQTGSCSPPIGWPGPDFNRSVFPQCFASPADCLHEYPRTALDIETFAHVVAHDLKAPLNGIASLVDFVVEDYGDRLDDEGRDQLRLIQAMAVRGVATVDALRQFARLSTVPVNPRRVDLAGACTRAATRVQARFPDIAVDVVVAPDLPAVSADPALVPLLLDALFTNAVQYDTRPHRTVRVAAADPTPHPVPSGHAACAVHDDGIGIPVEQREAVFALLKRLHGHDKFGGGVGAGLAHAKLIVERHGGAIWFEDVPAGTTVAFTLPAAPAASAGGAS